MDKRDRRELFAAARLYRSFREREPDRVASVRIKLPRAVAVIGRVEFIGYSTTHGNREQPYVHNFEHGAQPLLCAGTRDNQLYLIGGKYRVNSRGIVLSLKRRR